MQSFEEKKTIVTFFYFSCQSFVVQSLMRSFSLLRCDKFIKQSVMLKEMYISLIHI